MGRSHIVGGRGLHKWWQARRPPPTKYCATLMNGETLLHAKNSGRINLEVRGSETISKETRILPSLVSGRSFKFNMGFWRELRHLNLQFGMNKAVKNNLFRDSWSRAGHLFSKWQSSTYANAAVKKPLVHQMRHLTRCRNGKVEPPRGANRILYWGWSKSFGHQIAAPSLVFLYPKNMFTSTCVCSACKEWS
jgi:hypothetical protein